METKNAKAAQPHAEDWISGRSLAWFVPGTFAKVLVLDTGGAVGELAAGWGACGVWLERWFFRLQK